MRKARLYSPVMTTSLARCRTRYSSPARLRRSIATGLLAALAWPGLAPSAHAGEGVGAHNSASGARLTAIEAGAYFGQAKSVATFCPGGRLTGGADTLSSGYQGADRDLFEAEAQRIEAQWRVAMACREADEAGRPNTQCRRIKLLTCRQAWAEIGPEGNRVPGLITFEIDAPRDAR